MAQTWCGTISVIPEEQDLKQTLADDKDSVSTASSSPRLQDGDDEDFEALFGELEKDMAKDVDEPAYVKTFDRVDFLGTWDPIESSSQPMKMPLPCTWDPVEAPMAAKAQGQAQMAMAKSHIQIQLFQPPPGMVFQQVTLQQPVVVQQQSVVQQSTIPAKQTSPSGVSTTMMLRKLPRHFTIERLISVLNSENLRGSYDFLYLPRDMRTFKSFTYCFINWLTPALAQAAMDRFNGYKLDGAVLTTQWVVDGYGLDTQIEKHRNKPYMHPSVPQEFKPMKFQNGCLVEFPKPTQEIPMPQLGYQ